MCNSRRTNVMPRDGDRAYDRVWDKAIDLFMIWLDLIISLTGVWTGKKIHRKRHLSGLEVARSRVCRGKNPKYAQRRLANDVQTSKASQYCYADKHCYTNDPD